MSQNRLLKQLRAGQVILGLANMYPAAGIIEGMCKGWDFVWIDGQHGEMSYDSCLRAAQAATATGIDSLIRVPGHDHRDLGMFADLAPAAIMVPMVDSVEQAKGIVQGLRFPPLGNRSYGGRRIIDLHGRNYVQETELLVVAQIETLEAAACADEIAAVDGIDLLFFGPDDMKVRMGIPINTPINENDELRKAMAQTATAARNAGKFAGTVAGTTAAAEMVTELGYQLLTGGGDIAFLRTLAAEKLSALREITASTCETPDGTSSSGVY